MTLFIDGDALPNQLKPVIFRAIIRLELTTCVVSNKPIRIGKKSRFITYELVGEGADEADHKIVELVCEGDLVITADIPLADRIICKKAHALDHRGKLFTTENIKASLAMRNLMQDIRDSGELTRGPAPFSKKDVHNFANKLDMFLTKIAGK